MILIRPYQRAAIIAVLQAIEADQHNGLWVLPTGTGKTAAFVELIRLLGLQTLILVHRVELIDQTIAHLERQCPWLSVGVVQGDRNEWNADVVIAMVPSCSKERLSKIDRGRFGLMVVDECHHGGGAESWQKVMFHFAVTFRLGVTATPCRLDGRGLADWFGDQILYQFPLRKAIEDGWLARVRQYVIKTELNLDDVDVRDGDFALGQLANAVNTSERNAVIVEAWQKHGEDRKTLGFAVDVQHAADLALTFDEDGVSAAYIDGTMSSADRAGNLVRFKVGAVKVLLNCQILTEGFDDPSVECVLMARPTQSWALYAQMAGRGMRLFPGKRDLVILDAADLSSRHRLVKAFDLMGSKKDDADGGDVLKQIEADEKAEELRQERIREDIRRGPLEWRLESVCPWPELPSLEGYEPSAPWHKDPASEKQIKFLTRFGVKVQRSLTKGEAGHLIDKCLDYEAAYPAAATERQEMYLRFHGAWIEGMTKKEATQAIARLKSEARESA